MWILIILFKMYIAVILTVIVHESMHYFVATLIKVRVVNIAFGNSLHLFRIGKCLISPLIFSGYIEVDQEELYSKKKVVVILFYISGIIGNIILTIVAWRLHNYWGIWLIIYNISAIMVNVLPIAENNDVVAMYNYIKIESERGDQL